MSAARKLKILHLTYVMRIGGTEQVIKNLVDNTASSHHIFFQNIWEGRCLLFIAFEYEAMMDTAKKF